ncbi:hypothetical protein H0A36_15985 [Endozoicomonas sp. SM1973]|uniref:Uncharacterized protein n=1 Tax=Spartinivicinus marinus TaxID=2994442 RepID=A0A853IA36_9GAMM|nr:hypothetical protein [Spartinivicinus marinus]MCX4029812.1 hypothetical protein [Spartinivicinus marinus]NYZ67518.1 hypothetical protein [Spartinivicinus marinus]
MKALKYLLAIYLFTSINVQADITFKVDSPDKATLKISTNNLTNANIEPSKNSTLLLNLSFDLASSLKIGEFTEKHIGNKFSFYVDNMLVSTTTLQGTIGPDSITRKIKNQPA